MKFQIYYKDKISMSFEGITKALVDGKEVDTLELIDKILSYLADKADYDNISIRIMNQVIIPSPTEFNIISDINIKKRVLQAFKELNKNIEFIKEN